MLSNVYRFKNKNKTVGLDLAIYNIDNKYFIKRQDLDLLRVKLRNYFKQPKGSLFYDRNIGSNLYTYVFENYSDSLVNQIRNDLMNELNYNINGISIKDIDIEKDKTPDGKDALKINVTINSDNSNYEMVIYVYENTISFM